MACGAEVGLLLGSVGRLEVVQVGVGIIQEGVKERGVNSKMSVFEKIYFTLAVLAGLGLLVGLIGLAVYDFGCKWACYALVLPLFFLFLSALIVVAFAIAAIWGVNVGKLTPYLKERWEDME